jgi:hypothetical protein
MKNYILIFLTNAIFISTINYFLSSSNKLAFIDLTFFIGLIYTLLIYYFANDGGFLKRYLDLSNQEDGPVFITEDIYEQKELVENSIYLKNPLFSSSLLFTIFGIVAVMYTYWDKF